MKKKQFRLSELKVSSFTTVEGRELRGGFEREADGLGGSVANCDTDCIGRYCDPT
ncbi:MAG: hypothetical protein WBB45_21645 [Cyclobacteriaceae bacterium]